MKKTVLLLTILLLSNLSLFAQSPTSIQCTLSVEEISAVQPFDLDHPKQEETRELSMVIISELTIIYDLINQGNTTGLESHIEAVEASIDAAILLGMNYSMFQADLDFIETQN